MKKVMIVDDAMFMRQTLRLMLERNGFEIVGEAENGEQAIKRYKELQPDIVTMDITMPIMNGIDATKSIIALDPSAKICIVSALGQEEHVRHAIVNGARNFVVKPFKEATIIKTLEVI